jgi:hypothetical protein
MLAQANRRLYDTRTLNLRMMIRRALEAAILAILILAIPTLGATATTGTLKLDVLGDIGAGAKNPAHVIAADGKPAGDVAAGATIDLPPGNYKLVLPIVGGEIKKDDIKIEAGRTHTVLIQAVAVLQVSVKDRTGKDPGFGVTVTTTDEPHAKVASFLSGDKFLFAPNEVDVHVDAPPQGYDWHAVKLEPGARARLSLDEVVPADLSVQTTLQKLAIDEATRVVIYHAGTQSQVAESQPGRDHHFTLTPGDYDIYVENRTGKGKPYATTTGVHLDSGAKVERTVPLD